MDTVQDRNGLDLTEAESIKKRWREDPEEIYKKDLHDPDNHNGVITDLESDILEYNVKWALGSNTTKIVEVKESSCDSSNPKRRCCKSSALSMAANLENSAGTTGLENVSCIPIPKKGNVKNAQTTAQLHSFHMPAK